MYSPGPVNLIGLNSGLNGRFRQSIQFFAGVGLAMAILFLLFGYTGQAISKTSHLPFIASPGCLCLPPHHIPPSNDEKPKFTIA